MYIRRSTQHAKAYYLYMNTSLTQEQISKAAAVTRKTVGKWIKKENWAAQKQARYYSPDQEVQQLYEQFRKINERIAKRTDEGGIITKEEVELKAKLGALIALLEKHAGNWRNIAPEYDAHNPNIIDLSALSALEKKNLEKRQKAAEEDARLGPGKRFSEEELNEYYIKIANLKFACDSESAKFGKDGKPLAEDDPQRVKWEERIRQGKRPFVDDDEYRKEESGHEDKKDDDFPDGETGMDKPEEEGQE